jgi:hypothetical protein
MAHGLPQFSGAAFGYQNNHAFEEQTKVMLQHRTHPGVPFFWEASFDEKITLAHKFVLHAAVSHA